MEIWPSQPNAAFTGVVKDYQSDLIHLFTSFKKKKKKINSLSEKHSFVTLQYLILNSKISHRYCQITFVKSLHRSDVTKCYSVTFQYWGKTPVRYQRKGRCNTAMPSLTINFITNCKNRWSRYILREKEGTMFKHGRVCKDKMQGREGKKTYPEFLIESQNHWGWNQ